MILIEVIKYGIEKSIQVVYKPRKKDQKGVCEDDD